MPKKILTLAIDVSDFSERQISSLVDEMLAQTEHNDEEHDDGDETHPEGKVLSETIHIEHYE